MNINLKQTLAILVAILGVVAVSSAQLTDIIGPSSTKIVVSLAGFMNTIVASVLAVISSQTGLVKDVQSMPGVEKITVNAQANSTLAGLAVAPENPKIEAAPGADAAVNEAAKG